MDTTRALVMNRRVLPLVVAAKPRHQLSRQRIDPAVNFFAAESMGPGQG
jgi:hypothetical protein